MAVRANYSGLTMLKFLAAPGGVPDLERLRAKFDSVYSFISKHSRMTV